MARAHFVKKARKDNPAVKKGESYWYWSFRYGGKHYSTTRPKRSQLTQSAFLSQQYTIEDDVLGAGLDEQMDRESAQAVVDDAKSQVEELGVEVQDSLDNVPESLQDSHMLTQRLYDMEEWQNQLEDIHSRLDDPDLDPDELPDLITEARDCCYQGE